jgi:urea transporter
MVEWWLRGVSQVFLIDSWVTGVLFLIGLSLSSGRAALWAAIGSGVALLAASAFGAPADGVSAGLYGFSATLTGIALGDTFGGRGWRSWLWAITGVVATVFIQAGMNALVAPLGLPTLTAPFCVATWLFLLPGLKWADR